MLSHFSCSILLRNCPNNMLFVLAVQLLGKLTFLGFLCSPMLFSSSELWLV